MEYKTLRYPGHAYIMQAIRELGLLDMQPLEVKGHRVVPRDAFVAAVTPKLKKPGGHDVVALRVIAEGSKGGAPTRVGWEVIDRYDAERGISAMMRTTGYSLSITAQLQVAGAAGRGGVCTPDEGVPPARYIEELRARGIDVRPIDFAAFERRSGEDRRAEALA